MLDRRLTPVSVALFAAFALVAAGCSTSYKAQPLPFKAPSAYGNMTEVDGAQVGGRAFSDPEAAKQAFGFDIRGAGMLPVQLVFDNQGRQALEIDPAQTFLEDDQGNLWPVLTDRFAYERATKYAQTKQIFKEGAYSGFLGAAAGTLIGAAIGIVSGDNVASAVGKGAAVGAAGGAVLGGAKAGTEDEARNYIVRDLREKALANKAILPGELAHGIIFFPGEAKSARQLRLSLKEQGTGVRRTVFLNLGPAAKG